MRVRAVLVASLVVVVMTLSGGAQQATPPAQTAAPAQASPLTQAALVARAEAIVDSFAARDFDKVFAQFNAGMKQALPQEKLPGTWDTILTQAGAFVKRTGTAVEVRGVYTLVAVSADFERNKATILVTLDAAGDIAGFRVGPAAPPVVYAPPDYATAASFTEEDVTVGAAGWPLPGTLTMPVGAGPFPAIVLVHGSGPNDRDETFGPNKTFKDLALGLASRGIAVLRYDKRTKVHAAKLPSLTSFTVQDEAIDDALTAVALLRKTARIDPRRIYVLGHSLGGTVIPRIGAADPALAGLIVMAGAVRPLERSILEQIQYLADADGKISDAEQRAIEEAKKLADAVSKLTPADAKSMTNLGGAPYVVLAGSARLRSREARRVARAAAAHSPGRARLSGDGRRFREVEGGTRRPAERRIPSVSDAQPSVSAGAGKEPAGGVHDPGPRPARSHHRHRGLGQVSRAHLTDAGGCCASAQTAPDTTSTRVSRV